MGFSADKQYFALSTENKQMIVFNDKFEPVKNIILSRTSSKICFSPKNDLLVADRTGDVYLYKLSDEKDEPQLLLGHLSVISDMLITDCGRYVITCDRDEKVRVSCFPNGYNIISYCLGHTEFVTTLKMIKSANVLLSASGDGTVRMWNYLEGKQINIINAGKLVDDQSLASFAKKMDSEKVDISALPITDMQICETQFDVLLALSLATVGKLFLFKICPNNLEYSYVQSIEVFSPDFTYFYDTNNSNLYVFSDKMFVYKFIDGKYVVLSSNSYEGTLGKFKEGFVKENSDISVWYKRRFDNVQEYLERKKMRLQVK
ncbi:tRNA (guanine-N(7)-)-methyltransferase non-catalytic subunit wuho isoform X2 [Anthonomus grandis grandis]|nr:tRNA (guanine-N(7)-)-methyltransferase non-catalytic subunit wuho isoform X2 [Anthonomus grandis grandis]